MATMASNLSYVTCLTVYLSLAHVLRVGHVQTSGVHWRLDATLGTISSVDRPPGAPRVNSTAAQPDSDAAQDRIMQVLFSSSSQQGVWNRRETLSFCSNPHTPCGADPAAAVAATQMENSRQSGGSQQPGSAVTASSTGNRSSSTGTEDSLDCGKPVNYTHYDHLVGVSNRQNHPHVPEPNAGLVFRRKGDDKGGAGGGGMDSNSGVDLDGLERKLRRSKREKPKSLQLYNQIGNFWRIKGDTFKAIECFRRALAVSPNNAEVLLNLARVLFNLQYLDDAIFLTRRSLELQPPEQNAWLQHFTLGEILKEYGNYQEAELHLRHTLELRPKFQPAEAALRQLETTPSHRLHVSTVCIIVILVLCVLLCILSTLETAPSEEGSGDPGGRSARGGLRAHRGRWRRSV